MVSEKRKFHKWSKLKNSQNYSILIYKHRRGVISRNKWAYSTLRNKKKYYFAKLLLLTNLVALKI